MMMDSWLKTISITSWPIKCIGIESDGYTINYEKYIFMKIYEDKMMLVMRVTKLELIEISREEKGYWLIKIRKIDRII